MDSTVSSNNGNMQGNNSQPFYSYEELCSCGIEIGSVEYYDLIADQYGRDPSDQARGTWMQAVINEYKDWIGLTSEPEGDIKALDYCAGTGLMSHALAPYVNKIIGYDSSKNMTIRYAKIAEETLDDHPNCLMISVRGDMIHPNPNPIGIPADYMPFDIVAMCLGVDMLAPNFDLHDDVPALIRALASLISRMAQGGTLLMLEIEKEYEGVGGYEGEEEDYDAMWEHSMHISKKLLSYGSREICTALEALGMEDIEVKSDLWYEEPSEGGKIYFLLKAKKGDAYRGLAAENVKE